ncbi:MAG: hypothetical protein ACK44W_07615 [Planctomycetota bacterium]
MKRFALGRRRPSRLGDLKRQELVEDARRMSPEERVRLAVQLSTALGAVHRAGRALRGPTPPPGISS